MPALLCAFIMAIVGTLAYKGAEMEHKAGWPWAVLSVAVWGAAFFWAGWGVWLNLLAQSGVILLLAVVLILRKKKPEVIK